MKLYRTECTVVTYFLMPDNHPDEDLVIASEEAILNELEERGGDHNCHMATRIAAFDEVPAHEIDIVPWDMSGTLLDERPIAKLFREGVIA